MVTLYFLFSILLMVLNFIPLRKLLLSDLYCPHIYAILISCVPIIFHAYVLDF